jgi:hypothetical protein
MANDNQKQGQPQRGNQSGSKKNRDRGGGDDRQPQGGQRQEPNSPQQGDSRNKPGDQAGQSRDSNRRS